MAAAEMKDTTDEAPKPGAHTKADTQEHTPHDETVPGGRYSVNGQIVDAEGKPIK